MLVSTWIPSILGTLLLTSAGARSFEATNVVTVNCGESVLMRVSDGAPKQGSIGVVELRSEAPLVSVNGFLGSELLSFWHDDDARVFQALFGVDLQKSPGTAALRAKAVPESGPALECSVELRITDGAFPVQRLEVAPKYVELSSEDLARSKRESAELLEVFSSMTNERLWQGPFRAPVVDQQPSGSFGKRRVFNDQPRSPHSGEDFSAPAGTPVRATARGRVVLSKGLFFLGNTVILDHGLGLFSFYGHLSSIAVERGTIVEGDATIGQVGATGRVTGAHLHWGVRLGDARVDPMGLIALGR